MKNIIKAIAIVMSSLLLMIFFAPECLVQMTKPFMGKNYQNLVLVDSWDEKNNEDMFYLYLSRDGKTAHVIFHGGPNGETHWGDARGAVEEIWLHHEEEMEHVDTVVFHCCYPAAQPSLFFVRGGKVAVMRGERKACAYYRNTRSDGFSITPDPQSLVKETLLGFVH